MITRARTINAIPYIIEASSKVDGFQYAEEDISLYMVSRIASSSTFVLIDFDSDGKLNGLLVAELGNTLITPEIMVLICYVNPNDKKLGDVFMSRVEEWARANKVKHISAMVHRGTNGFIKKYGFEVHSQYIRKEVGG